MKITILTLFKEQFVSFVNTSIIKRAIERNLVEIEVIDFREFSDDKLKRVDDAPYGGGAGMIIKLQPIVDCLKKIKTPNSKVYLLSASGQVYNQKVAHEFANIDHLILICGHYEGVDARISNYIDGEICVGDYILTGGEIPAMLVADSIIRLLDGVIKKESTTDESFENNLLEYPQFTAPKVYDGYQVPDILFTGNHQAIAEFRFKESIKKTLSVRPELINVENMSKQELKWFNDIQNNTSLEKAIEKAKKFVK